MASKQEKRNALKVKVGEVSMTNAGHKLGGSSKPIDISNKVYYPTVYLSTKDVPALAGLPVGEDVTIVAKARVRSCSSTETPDGKTEDYTIELRNVGVVSPKGKKEGKESY